MPWMMTAASASHPSRRTQRSRFRAPEKDHEPDREHADDGRDQPMAVLVEDAADHAAEREREHLVAVGGRPVGHGEAGVRARDHAAGRDEEERRGDEQTSVAMEPDHRTASVGAERERQRRRVAGADGDLRGPRAELLVPRFDRVGAGRHARRTRTCRQRRSPRRTDAAITPTYAAIHPCTSHLKRTMTSGAVNVCRIGRDAWSQGRG